MLTLPSEYLTLIETFAPVFSNRVWQHVQILLARAILAPGKRTVTSVLRVMGLSQTKHFQNYHRVLNRAVWSSLQLSRLLLMLLVTTFAATGPILVELDDTIERRRGAKIKAKGIYRDPVRSSHSHFVKASGLRWLSLIQPTCKTTQHSTVHINTRPGWSRFRERHAGDQRRRAHGSQARVCGARAGVVGKWSVIRGQRDGAT